MEQLWATSAVSKTWKMLGIYFKVPRAIFLNKKNQL